MESQSDIVNEWMGASRIVDGFPSIYNLLQADWVGASAAVIVTQPNGPFPAGCSGPIYSGQIVDATGVGIPAANLSALTLTLVDTLTRAVINGVSQVDILNTGRGTVDTHGNLVISLTTADTSMTETTADTVQRSMVIDWTIISPAGTGRKQVNFQLVALAGA